MKTKKSSPILKVLLSLLILFQFITAFAQDDIHKTIGGKDLVKKNSNWFLRTKKGEFRLNETLTVYVGNKDLNRLGNSIRKVGGEIIRINKLGYADIKIGESDFFTKLSSLETDNRGDYKFELNSYGEYVLNPDDDNYRTDQSNYLFQINIPKAWDLTLGTNCVTVAIVDSGTDWLHPDLGNGTDGYRNIWTNNGEDDFGNNPGSGDGVDNDGNGFIDDFIGWDFDSNNNDARSTNTHGTGVAGIVSAKTDNNRGIAGIAGGNNVQGTLLMPLEVGVNSPNGAVVDDAIIYAVDNGARIIQLSLSVAQTPAIEAAIHYARTNNVTLVCSAGNSGPSISYPASNSNVIAVGSVNSSGNRSSFSNTGPELDVMAPGENIFSTQLNGGYGASSGTSFAAPMVSGIVSLMLNLDPTLTPSEIESILENTATDVGSSGFDSQTGHGIVNAEDALLSVISVSGPSQLCSGNQGTFTVSSLPTGMTISWNKWAGLGFVSGQNSSSLVVQANSADGKGWVQPVLTNICGDAVTLPRYYFNQGEPTWDPNIELENGADGSSWYFCTSHNGNNYTISPINGMNTHQVRIKSLSGSVLWTSGTRSGSTGSVNYYPSPGYYLMEVRATNSCGTSSWSGNEIEFVDCSIGGGGGGEFGEFTIYPNPIDNGIVFIEENFTQISFAQQNDSNLRNQILNKESFTANSESQEPYKVLMISELTQQIVISETCNNKSLQLDINDLPKGNYILKIAKGDKRETRRIVIN